MALSWRIIVVVRLLVLTACVVSCSLHWRNIGEIPHLSHNILFVPELEVSLLTGLFLRPTMPPLPNRVDIHGFREHRKCLHLTETPACGSSVNILLLLVLCSDIEINLLALGINPGPNCKFPCARCDKPVKSNQKGLQCDACDRWFHSVCEHLPTGDYFALASYDDSWYCAQCYLPPLSDSFFEPASSSHYGAYLCPGPSEDDDADILVASK